MHLTLIITVIIFATCWIRAFCAMSTDPDTGGPDNWWDIVVMVGIILSGLVGLVLIGAELARHHFHGVW